MIEKDGIEWQMWKDAFNIRAELTPPPKYSESGEYWGQALEKLHEGFNQYEHTHLKELAENVFLGILLQLEEESKRQEQIESIVQETAERLKIGF